QDVINTVRMEHAELPSGRISNNVREVNLRTLGEAPTVEQFRKIAITQRGGSTNFRPIPLEDVAQIEDGIEELRRKTRVNGMSAVGVGIRKQRGSNAVEVAHKVKERVQEIQATLPDGVEISV